MAEYACCVARFGCVKVVAYVLDADLLLTMASVACCLLPVVCYVRMIDCVRNLRPVACGQLMLPRHIKVALRPVH